MLENRSLIGNKTGFYNLKDFEAVDVDTPLDFFIAEQIYKKHFKK